MEEELQTIANAEKDTFKVFTDVAHTVDKFMHNFCIGQKKSKTNDNIGELIKKLLNDDKVTNFTFTGKNTDLCYFNQSDTMPLSAISNISDPNIKNAVVDNFDKCINKGLLELKDGYLKITSKGKAEISKPNFLKTAQNDQLQAYNNTINKIVKNSTADGSVQMGAALSGDYMNDFTFFNHTDKMDLSKIMSHPNKELSQKILSNVKKWQNAGAVTVKNGVATVTDMGKKMLNLPQFQAATKPVAEQAMTNAAGAAGQIIVATKKVVGAVVQAVQSANQSMTR